MDNLNIRAVIASFPNPKYMTEHVAPLLTRTTEHAVYKTQRTSEPQSCLHAIFTQAVIIRRLRNTEVRSAAAQQPQSTVLNDKNGEETPPQTQGNEQSSARDIRVPTAAQRTTPAQVRPQRNKQAAVT